MLNKFWKEKNAPDPFGRGHLNCIVESYFRYFLTAIQLMRASMAMWTMRAARSMWAANTRRIVRMVNENRIMRDGIMVHMEHTVEHMVHVQGVKMERIHVAVHRVMHKRRIAVMMTTATRIGREARLQGIVNAEAVLLA